MESLSNSASGRTETLAFSIHEGLNRNYFVRKGEVAAHVVCTSGESPRILIAFPAGNTGAGIWFRTDANVDLLAFGDSEVVVREDGMRGVRMRMVASSPVLRIARAGLGNIRALREFGQRGQLPVEMRHTVEVGPGLRLCRTELDGVHRIEVVIEPEDGTTLDATIGDEVILRGRPGSPLRFSLMGLCDEPPLTPIEESRILVDSAGADPELRRALAFLTYEEKLLAGSYRFLTYFGRDTLITLQLLLPVLRCEVIEAGLGAVLERVGQDGDVAHEESIGDWAAFEHLRAGHGPEVFGTPIFDDGMVDDDFLLAPILSAYLLDHPVGRTRAEEFLSRKTASGISYREIVRKNLALVLRRATPLGDSFQPENLIPLKPGKEVGDWRDSATGLGGGRIPFSVNVALVPAALEAARRLYGSGFLGTCADEASRSDSLRAVWRRAAQFFRIEVPADSARRRLAIYSAELGIDPESALSTVEESVVFEALALDGCGKPIPIMHSDDAFVLLFGDPDEALLNEAASRILRPFPAGLRTPVGIVVSNPAYCEDVAVRRLFSSAHYHGTVIWSWQQAMLYAGLRRQLSRADLGGATLRRISAAAEELANVIRTTASFRTSELWSFSCERGVFELVPFGEKASHHDESNAIQLWSTVFLAIPEVFSAGAR